MRLFTRLLLAQMATAATVALLLVVLFYSERASSIAALVAQRWAPTLQRLAEPGPDLTLGGVQRRARRPADARPIPGLAPRFMSLRSELASQGLQVRQLALQNESTQPVLWVEVDAIGSPVPGGAGIWLGISDTLIEPFLPARLLSALAIVGCVAAGMSWWLAQRLSRPLERLRQRLAGHRPGRPEPAAPPADASAGPEIVAIDQAWHDMRERLARHERERALMLAGVSHDLRAPLSRIRMAAGLLPDGPAIDPRRDTIVRNVRVADRLLEGFLDHARAQQLPLDEPVDLAPLAHDLAEARADDGVTLVAPPSLLLPAANALLLERVLANLLDNACHHGRPPVRLHLCQQGDQACIEVQDSGSGIAPEQQEAALQAFARGDDSRGQPGTGLGLAIVRDTVDRLGGRIAFERQPGSFTVRLLLPLVR